MATESTEVIFNFEGRVISIEKFSNETEQYFEERASFILTFRNQPHLFQQAKFLSFHHANKIFKGVIYSPEAEELLAKFRKIHAENFRE